MPRRYGIEQRNALARRRGFRNYYEQRKTVERLNKDPEFREGFERGVPSGNWRDDPKALSTWLRATEERGKTKYDDRSKTADWYIDYTHDVASRAEWRALYGKQSGTSRR